MVGQDFQLPLVGIPPPPLQRLPRLAEPTLCPRKAFGNQGLFKPCKHNAVTVMRDGWSNDLRIVIVVLVVVVKAQAAQQIPCSANNTYALTQFAGHGL